MANYTASASPCEGCIYRAHIILSIGSRRELERSEPGFAHRAYFATGCAAAVKDSGTVALEARNGDTFRHLDPLEDLARFGDNAAEFTFLGFQGAVPELTVNPGNPRDETV